MLVLDEIGYLAHAADAANVLYRVVNERYLRQLPILVTTNKPLAAWGTSSMMGTWPKPSSTACSNAARISKCVVAPTAPATSRRSTARHPPPHDPRHGSGCDRI